MLEVKGNSGEIQVFKESISDLSDCVFDFKYCDCEKILNNGFQNCEECIKEHIKFIIEEKS